MFELYVNEVKRFYVKDMQKTCGIMIILYDMKKDAEYNNTRSKSTSSITTNVTNKLVFKDRLVKIHNSLLTESSVEVDPRR